MKILFVNEYAHPHIVSGAELSTLALANELNASKKAKIFTLSPNLSSSATPTGRLPVGQIKFPFPKKISPGKILTPLWFNNPIFWIYAAFYIAKTVKDHHIDLIHVHGKYIQPPAIIASWFSKIPVITTVRDFKFLCPLALCYTHQQKKCSYPYYIYKEIPEYFNSYTKGKSLKPLIILRLILAKLGQNDLKWFLNRSKQVVAVSPQLAKIYEYAGVKNITAIYNLPPKSMKIIKRSGQTIVSIGKLSYGKGTDTLLKAMEILRTKLPQAKLVIAGRKNISLKQSFPSNTLHLGLRPHRNMKDLLAKAQVFVILSRWPEPLSRAGLEALSAGLAILASNRGGNQELIKDNGFLVDPDKPQKVADKLVKLLTSKNLKTYQRNSHKLLNSRFNRKAIINQHLKLYQSLL